MGAAVVVTEVGFAPAYVGYAEAWELQRRTHAEVLAGTAPPTLLLLEHEPVYTAGRRTEDFERPTDGAPVVDVDRGGKITWHGPGQLVGYPILRLPMPLDVVDVTAERDIRYSNWLQPQRLLSTRQLVLRNWFSSRPLIRS
jgi:lipoate-protein ligase B